jgi:DNA-binding NarL/FixJ family response regulator
MTTASVIRVAIVDDHEMVRKSLNEILTLWGYPVLLQATNGKDFLQQLIEDNLPDICILDMNMPEMNGTETIKVLKEKWPGIKIIVFSMNIDNLKSVPVWGADAMVPKGGNVMELKESIEHLGMQKAILIQ